jgi:DNA-binding transcriptional LysR family regulator
MERFPDIPLEVDLGDVGASDAIEHDVILHSGEWQSGSADIGAWVTRVLGAPPSILCASPVYLGKVTLPQNPQQLAALDVLTPEAAGSSFVLRLSQGSRREEVTLRPKLAVNDPALRHSAVAAGLGVGLLPEFLCRQGLAAQKLKRILAEWDLPPQPPLCAVYPARLAEDPRVKSLVDFLAAHIVPALAG